MGKIRRIYRRRKIAMSLCFILIGMSLSIVGLNLCIEPNIEAVSRLKAEGIINTMISETVEEEFSKEIDKSDFFSVRYGNDGKIQMVQADAVLINRKMAKMSSALQKKYDCLEPETIYIPVGTMIGSTLLSQTDGGMELQILPLSVVSCDYVTDFESQGINQTKYKLFAEIKSNVQLLKPFSRETFKIISKVLILETVILGDVPENYVQVPKEDILDVT